MSNNKFLPPSYYAKCTCYKNGMLFFLYINHSIQKRTCVAKSRVTNLMTWSDPRQRCNTARRTWESQRTALLDSSSSQHGLSHTCLHLQVTPSSIFHKSHQLINGHLVIIHLEDCLASKSINELVHKKEKKQRCVLFTNQTTPMALLCVLPKSMVVWGWAEAAAWNTWHEQGSWLLPRKRG